MAEIIENWEIRKSGKTCVSSPVKNCGYSDSELKSLNRAGYSLYHNGKCVMKGRKNGG